MGKQPQFDPDLDRAQLYAGEVLSLELEGYERRLHDQRAQLVFTSGRQADLFAAVNAQAEAERLLDQQLRHQERLDRLSDALGGCLADGCTGLRMVVTTRRGAEKAVVFDDAKSAARFAVAVQDAKLPWRVERQVRARAVDVEASRLAFESRLRYAGGVPALQYLLGRGLKYEAVMRMSQKAEADLRVLLEAEKASRWRAQQRRWREVREAQERVERSLATGDTMARVLARQGVRPETYAGEDMVLVARRAALQALAPRNRKLLESFELQDLLCTSPRDGTGPLLRRIVVVDSAADVLAYRQIHAGEPGETAFISLGLAPLVDDDSLRKDGLAPNGRSFEQILLSERWRHWEAREEAPTVVLALGTGPESKQRSAILRRLVPRERMPIERTAPQHASTWWEELLKRERDFIRAAEMSGPAPARGAQRQIGLSP